MMKTPDLKISDLEEFEKLKDFITTGEIIRLARVHPGSVYNWRAGGKIVPIHKAGATYLYNRKEVMKFIKKRNAKIKKNRKGHWGS